MDFRFLYKNIQTGYTLNVRDLQSYKQVSTVIIVYDVTDCLTFLRSIAS